MTTGTRSRSALIAGLLAATLLAALAAAQSFSSFAGRRGGSGTLQGANGSSDLSEAEVRLRDGGSVLITVRDRRSSFQFSGTWRKDRGDYIKLQIGDASGRPAEASGWVLVRDGRFEQIEIDGRTEGGRKLALSFTATGRDLPVEPEWSGSSKEAEGWGELERQRGKEGIERARVELRPDGSATVTLWTSSQQRIEGTWSDRRDDSVRIDIREAFGDTRASGNGTIRFRRGELERLDLSGESYRGGFRVDFSAGAERPRPTRPPSHGRFDVEYGFDQPGGDYRNLRADALDDCQDACAADGRCRAFTYNTSDRRCYLKDSERSMVRRSDTVTGIKRGGGGGGSGLSERQGYDLEGGDYTRVRLDGLDQCQEACRRDRECLAYTWITGDRMCYLKDRIGNYTPRRDAVSGEKGGRGY